MKDVSTPDIWFPNLGLSVEKIDRVAFKIFGIEIYWYGLLICLGMIIAVFVVMKEAKRTNQDPETYLDFVFWAILFGMIGSRTYFLMFYEGSLKSFFAIREGGLAIYGGIIGSIIAVLVYTKVKRLNVLKFMDTCAMSLLIGQIIGRWGNFVNREAFGGYTNGLLALRYKVSQLSGLVLNNDLTASYNGSVYPIEVYKGVEYIQVHPTFLYESLWNVLVLLIILIYRKHKKFEGELSAIYFIGYGIGRIWIESLRVDQLLVGGFPVSLMLSIVFVSAALIFEIVMRIRVRR